MPSYVHIAAAISVCAIATAQGQSKPAFRNGQQIEAQGPDGRWYRGQVWKVKKGNPHEYEVRFEGMPSQQRLWIPEPKVRAKGGGAVVDPECVKAVVAAKKLLQTVIAHGRQGKWTNDRWNRDLDKLTDQFEQAVQGIAERWPEEPIDQLKATPAKLRANTAMRRKQAGTAAAPKAVEASGGALIEPFYRAAAKGGESLPYTLSPKNVADAVAFLEQFNLAEVEARMAKDAETYPGVFAYYGKEDPQTYADLKYGGPKAPKIADADLQRIQKFHVPKIYKAKAKLLAAQAELVGGVDHLMGQAKSVDDAMAAVRLAKAIKACWPTHPQIDGSLTKAQALVDERIKAIAHLMRGPFHKPHMRQLVAFGSKPTLGSETQGDVVTELTPGKPLYLVGYLTESVKSLGFKRRDSTLGYETTRVPDLKFRFKGSTTHPWRLPVYSRLRGDDLDKLGVIEIPLLPDPATANYDSHLAYLPALHFTRWLLEQKPGKHVLELSAGPSINVDSTKQGAHGTLAFELNDTTRAELQAYYDALWAKKLAAVVYPDQFGVTDKQGEIRNVNHLAKYGKLLKLTFAKTNKVMKKFPNQHQIDNFVGQGFGLFEREGRYEVIGLSFSRKPEESNYRFTALRGVPSDYQLAGPSEVRPTLLKHGYEIPKANLGKTGAW